VVQKDRKKNKVLAHHRFEHHNKHNTYTNQYSSKLINKTTKSQEAVKAKT